MTAVTQTSGVIWLLKAVLHRCGRGTADEIARGLLDAWSGAAAVFGTAVGQPANETAH